MPKRAPRHRPLGAPSPETQAKAERQRQREVNARRDPSAAKPYKTKAWRAFRAWFIRRHPVCSTPGCHAPTAEVDHIIPLARGGALLDEQNCDGKCTPCHSRKTAAENRGEAGRFRRRNPA